MQRYVPSGGVPGKNGFHRECLSGNSLCSILYNIRTNDKDTVLINYSKTYVVHLIQVCGGVGMIYLLWADGADGYSMTTVLIGYQNPVLFAYVLAILTIYGFGDAVQVDFSYIKVIAQFDSE